MGMGRHQQAAGITGAQMIQLLQLDALLTQRRLFLIEACAVAQLTQHAEQTQAQVTALRFKLNGLAQYHQCLAKATVGDVDIGPIQGIRFGGRRTRRHPPAAHWRTSH